MNRKTFIATIISAICIWFLIPAHKVRSIYNRFKKPSSPNEHELKTASRIAEYIYPEDDAPGALSLGINNFFSIQFKTPYYKKYVPLVKCLTNYLDSESQKVNGKNFLSSETKTQNELLDSIAMGKKDHVITNIRKDFYTLVELTLEGCFSDPMYGGNKNKQAWNLLGGTFKEEWFYA